MIFPVFASTQRPLSLLPFSSAVVSQILSAKTTGDDQARPGNATFHSMFFVSLQSLGNAWPPGMCPEPNGPRNCGQSARATVVATTNSAAKTKRLARKFSVFNLKNFMCKGAPNSLMPFAFPQVKPAVIYPPAAAKSAQKRGQNPLVTQRSNR